MDLEVKNLSLYRYNELLETEKRFNETSDEIVFYSKQNKL